MLDKKSNVDAVYFILGNNNATIKDLAEYGFENLSKQFKLNTLKICSYLETFSRFMYNLNSFYL